MNRGPIPSFRLAWLLVLLLFGAPVSPLRAMDADGNMNDEEKKRDAELQKKAAEEARQREAEQRARLEQLRTAATSRSGKNSWIDSELGFASKLSEKGYEDLAQRVIAVVRDGSAYDGQKLTEDEARYVQSKMVKLEMEIIFGLSDPAEMITRATKALGQLSEAQKGLPDGALKQDALIDQVEVTFRLAEVFRKFLDESVGDDAADSGQKSGIAKLNGEINSLTEKIRFERNGKKKKELQDSLKAKKEALAKIIAEAKDLAPKALGFYIQGMAVAKPLLQEIIDNFDEVLGFMEEAEGKQEKAAMLKLAEMVFMRRVRLSHLIEKAYAGWALLLPRGSKELATLQQEAAEFFSVAVMDYEDMFPADKQVYFHWMTLLSCQDDPIGVKNEEGQQLAPVDPWNEDETDPLRYVWPSARIEFLLKHHFVKPKLPRGMEVPDSHRLKGLYYYGEAMMRMYHGALERVAKAQGEEKAAWEKRAAELRGEAERALHDLTQSESEILDLPVDQGTRLTTHLQLGSDLYEGTAAILLQQGDKAKAEEELQKALGQCGLVIASGNPAWKYHAEQRINRLTEFANAGGIDLVSIDSILAEAAGVLRDARKEVVLEKRQALIRQANDLYAKALEIAKHYRDPQRRAAYVLDIASRYGVNSLILEDWRSGYILNLFIAREFNYKDYPRDRFPGIESTFQRCLKNLRYAAGKMRKQENTDFARQMYVDALLLGIARSEAAGGGGEDLVVMLVNELRILGLYDEALQYIDQIPADHLYARTMLLVGAGVAQTRLKECRQLASRAPEGSPERAQYEKDAQKYAELAVKYSERYLASMESRKPLEEGAPARVKEVYEQETANIPAAVLIPLSIAFTDQKYDRVIELAEQLEQKLAKIQGLSDETKNEHLTTGFYLQLISILRQVDEKTDPEDKVIAALEKAEVVLPKLEKADAIGERVNQAYLLLGANWNNLGNRFERAGNKERLDAARLKAVGHFVKAEGAVYRQLPLALLVVRIYSDQGMHEKAEAVCDIAVRYWSESYFTEGHLLRAGKNPADLKAAAVTDGMKPHVDKLPLFAPITAAADAPALVEALNAFLRETKIVPNREAIVAALEAAKQAGVGGQDLQTAIAQALVLAARPDVDDDRILRHRVNRVLAESAYPELLARSSSQLPVLPTETEFVEAYGGEPGMPGFGSLYPVSEVGRKKALLLKAMHDPKVELGSDRRVIDAYVADLQARIEGAASQEQKARLQGWLDLLTPPGLRARIYGEPDGAELKYRSYYRARQMIQSLLAFDKMELKTSEPAEVPTAPLLHRIEEALTFGENIFSAQKRYVDALMALGKSEKALIYLRDLLALNPNDQDLKLKTARAEYLKAAQSETYGVAESAAFMRARLMTLEVYDRVARHALGSETFWDARMLLFDNDFAEIQQRAKHGKQVVDATYGVKWMRRHQGKDVEVMINTEAKLEDQGKKLANEIARLVHVPPPGLEIPDGIRKRLDDMQDKLKAMGYEPYSRAEAIKEAEEVLDEGPAAIPDAAPKSAE